MKFATDNLYLLEISASNADNRTEDSSRRESEVVLCRWDNLSFNGKMLHLAYFAI